VNYHIVKERYWLSPGCPRKKRITTKNNIKSSERDKRASKRGRGMPSKTVLYFFIAEFLGGKTRPQSILKIKKKERDEKPESSFTKMEKKDH